MVALTVMRVLLFVCELSMLRECEGASNTGVAVEGGMVAWCEYMGCSGVVSSADVC